MDEPDLPLLLARVRELSRDYQAGGQSAFKAFAELVSLLLHLTILENGPAVRLARGPERTRAAVQNAAGPGAPLLLRDGRYLKLDISLEIDSASGRLKVRQSRYQYQIDDAGREWAFRYDYLRYPGQQYAHPPSHLQVNGRLLADPPIITDSLKNVHFAIGRVPLEAVIRTLAVQFEIPCRRAAEIWMPVLTESEQLFLGIAHRPTSGPSWPPMP
jgi:hypothetical protein